MLTGISLDGDERTHSLHRSDFTAVMRGIRLLRQYGCDFNILTVVTDELCAALPEVWEFYRLEGFEYQQYIPCMAPPSGDPYCFLSELSYERFLTELYDMWREDLDRGRYVYIPPLQNGNDTIAG